MSNFWANKVGVQQPQQQAPPAPQPVRPWWQPAPVQQTQTAPAQQPQYQPGQPPAQPQQASVDPNQQYHIGDLLRQDGYTTTKAVSARSDERCPSCGSGNYLNIAGSETRPKRCFDCGHNPMFSHSTAGVTGTGQQNVAAPRAARVQVTAPPEGFPATGSLVQA